MSATSKIKSKIESYNERSLPKCVCGKQGDIINTISKGKGCCKNVTTVILRLVFTRNPVNRNFTERENIGK